MAAAILFSGESNRPLTPIDHTAGVHNVIMTCTCVIQSDRSRTKNQPKEEVFGPDVPRTSGDHSRGYPGPKLRRVESTPDGPRYFRKYRATPPISIAILLQKYALLLAEVVYTPPICITIRLPFVSRYFCRSIKVRGRWHAPNHCPSPLSCHTRMQKSVIMHAISCSLRVRKHQVNEGRAMLAASSSSNTPRHKTDTCRKILEELILREYIWGLYSDSREYRKYS